MHRKKDWIRKDGNTSLEKQSVHTSVALFGLNFSN
jgi:hypothetical protein